MRESTQKYLRALMKIFCEACPGNCKYIDLRCVEIAINMAIQYANKNEEMRDKKENEKNN